ncbi:metal-sensitive transcriptional regulator [Arthrobacter bambusae]|uniref:DNA-binding FrmR family transcriptional regulator n=1 Tax=Arthrobacter bambusae TaxID=1338426 RepID=A0AAW8DL10_9MICC|nr:metal-sensitive transcriptional regulator [Arthrobacter bambusae]MDP9906932.1 DNA-binding FrmR family transcriptional regulator [Arthrobacter bambusae]MDQ0131088.1 DNA-binding FrmR family transcriptional regulator [Arthrobacter bambusae]MDQ0182610.1 DNA-binding FrmR family transcriptional regulator [Arthrobacter bambusae]
MSTIDVEPTDLNPVDLNIGQPGIDVEDGAHAQHGYSSNKDAYLRRLKRIEGQVRGIARMVEEDKYCIDILTQVSAVTKALHAVSLGLVEEHIGHCVVGAASESDPVVRAEQIDIKVKEAADAIGRLLR